MADDQWMLHGPGYDPMRAMLLQIFLGNLKETIAKDPQAAIAQIDGLLRRLDEIKPTGA